MRWAVVEALMEDQIASGPKGLGSYIIFLKIKNYLVSISIYFFSAVSNLFVCVLRDTAGPGGG